jgi:hypothetical protein
MDQIGPDQVKLSPAQTSDYYRAMEVCLNTLGLFGEIVVHGLSMV